MKGPDKLPVHSSLAAIVCFVMSREAGTAAVPAYTSTVTDGMDALLQFKCKMVPKFKSIIFSRASRTLRGATQVVMFLSMTKK